MGEVSDIGFAVGESQATLVVKVADGSFLDLPWDSVSSAKDIVLVKSGVDLLKFKRTAPSAAAYTTSAQAQVQAQAQTQVAASAEKRFCTSCGRPLTWIQEYKRWYCYNEKKYA